MVMPFMAIYLNEQLKISLPECAMIMTFFGVGSVIGAFIGGILTDRFGFVPVMLASLFLTGFAFINFIRLETINELCLGIFLISLFADIFRPANLSAVQHFSKEENLTRSIGLVRLAINLGYAFGPFLGGVLAGTLGYSFLFIANASSVVLAGIVFLYFFNQRNSIPRLEQKDIDLSNVKMPWFDGRYLLYLFSFAFIAITFMQLVYIVPLYYKTVFKFDEISVGLLMGLNGLIIFLIEMPLIFLIEKWQPAVKFVIFGGLLIALSAISFILVPYAIAAAVIYTVLSTFGEMLSFPFSNTYALGFCNALNRGKYMGLYTMTFSVAHIISPYLWLNSVELYGWNTTWMIGMAMAAMASVMIYIVKK